MLVCVLFPACPMIAERPGSGAVDNPKFRIAKLQHGSP